VPATLSIDRVERHDAHAEFSDVFAKLLTVPAESSSDSARLFTVGAMRLVDHVELSVDDVDLLADDVERFADGQEFPLTARDTSMTASNTALTARTSQCTRASPH
jgi:hypothetical protein